MSLSLGSLNVTSVWSLWGEGANYARRLGSNDDSDDSVKESGQLLNTFYINMIIFWSLVGVFEMVRNWKSIYLNRLTKKFVQSKRVPPPPSRWPFAWVYTILLIPNEEVLRMVGLDGYMLLRFLLVCIRVASFFTFFGLIVLVPVYMHGGEGLAGWNKYTVANIKDSAEAYSLWTPVAFAYLFSIFYCQIFYYEYKNFIHKRVVYLVEGDLDTQMQTNYTVCVENIPASLRSAPMLTDFFERIFAGDVYSVEIALDLKELEDLTAHRREVRNKLEKAVAVYKATDQRPVVCVHRNFYAELEEEFKQAVQQGEQKRSEESGGDSSSSSPGSKPAGLLDLKQYMPAAVRGSTYSNLMNALGYEVYDSIQHHTLLLYILNKYVHNLQLYYDMQRQQMDRMEAGKLQEIQQLLYQRGLETGAKQVRSLASSLGNNISSLGSNISNIGSSLPLFVSAKRNGSSGDLGRLEGGKMVSYDTFGSAQRRSADGNGIDKGSRSGSGETVQNPLGHVAELGKTFSADGGEAKERGSSERVSALENKTVDAQGEETEQGYSDSSGKPSSGIDNLHSKTARLLSKLTTKTTRTYETGRELAKLGVENLTKESMRTAEYATKGVLRGVLEATRALELLTIGAYYRISSTAFVTFRSRVSALAACNILLSHEYYRMSVE
ncbi:hypothetical protein EON64_07835, partial [archaeon]